MKLNRAASLFLSIALLASVVVGYSTTASAVGNPNCNAVDGDYIVSFAPGVSVDKEIKSAPGRAVSAFHRYEAVLNGFAASLSAEQACAFEKRPNIRYVELDSIVTTQAITESALSWGLDRIDQTSLPLLGTYEYNSTGAGVTAFVIDTGISNTNKDFGTRLLSHENFTKDRKNYDCNGHGTHVAGTIGGTKYGIAKSVSLIGLKVLNCQGSGTISGVIAGVNRAATLHTTQPAVANMSLGGGVSPSLDAAVLALINDGVTVVVAAGNESADASTSSPANVDAAITVAASSSNDSFAGFSNFGSKVDLIAPGVEITSDWLVSSTNKAGVNTISGTSMASPHVAGVAARYLSTAPTSTPTQVRTALVGAATTGVVSGVPALTVNKLLFIGKDN